MWTEEDKRNSKYLCYLLLNGGPNLKQFTKRLKVSSDGFVLLNSILNLHHTKEHYNLSLAGVKKLIDESNIQRFELKREQGQFFIRALDLPVVKNAAAFPVVIYRTTKGKWDSMKDEGISLNPQENHIRFRPSRCKYDCEYEVVIEIDLKLAMDDGIEFYSSHGKLESPGIYGKIPPKYFKNVTKNVKIDSAMKTKQFEYLVHLLRHDALNQELELSPDGFVPLDSILELAKSKSLFISDENFHKLMEGDVKKKLQLKKANGKKFIRALHGHSIKGVLDYEKIFKREITDLDEFPLIVFGTTWDKWIKIEIEGITTKNNKSNDKNCIHFKAEPYKKADRRDVTIEIDLKLAMADGMKFYECFNGVIATPGIDGVVAPKYFKDVKEAFTEVVPNEYPTVVYCTSSQKWHNIYTQNKAIKPKGSRAHIHLSIGYPKKGQKDSEVYIEIDMEQAMDDGMKFYTTKNEGIVTQGIDGIIDKKYFKKITNKINPESNELGDAFAELQLY